MLSWIVWNTIVVVNEIVYLCQIELFEIELFYMLNWIVWNGTVFDIDSVYLC